MKSMKDLSYPWQRLTFNMELTEFNSELRPLKDLDRNKILNSCNNSILIKESIRYIRETTYFNRVMNIIILRRIFLDLMLTVMYVLYQ